LLDAALAVAERDGLGLLSVGAVTTEAGVAKGTFYVHFEDRAAVLVAIHRRFHDELFAEVLADTLGRMPGIERARARLVGFLDGCRRQSGVRAMLLQARSEPAVVAEVASRNDQAARVLADDLRAAAAPHPLETARLVVTAAAEVALLELTAGRTQPRLRAALMALVAPEPEVEPRPCTCRSCSPSSP
jgi:AcrR family transcriptional regulator